jgi:hypothetical protein
MEDSLVRRSYKFFQQFSKGKGEALLDYVCKQLLAAGQRLLYNICKLGSRPKG